MARVQPGGDPFRVPRPGSPVSYRGNPTAPGQTRQRQQPDMGAATGGGGAAGAFRAANPYGANGSGSPIPQQPPAANAPQSAPNPYGTESGNTYVEQRYLDRMSGTDPAYEYALKRGTETLGNRFSAAGGFNSGAARQAESDFYANALAQSQGQLDSLAGAATGARQRKLEGMFGTGLSLAGGQAGTVSPYALGAAGAMSAADQAYLYMLLNKAGVEGQARQGGLNALVNIGKTGAGFLGGRPGG